MYQLQEELHQVLHRQVHQVLVGEEQRGEIKMNSWYIIFGLLVLVVLAGYWTFFGGEE
tara:strand:+ start:169 stop:342 length:174 start_codon:yes stop_codon:yes gene_type:complete